MGDRVRITDVSPRDGLQNEPGFAPTAEKVRLIELLAEAGVDEVEAASFVSPKWVPQLADAEDVLRGAMEAMASRERPPALSALVPNQKGFERAAGLHSAERPLKIALFTAASETFSARNVNASIDETLERFAAFLPGAFEAGMPVRCYISCAVACPYEGSIAPDAVRSVADKLLALAPDGAFEDGRAELDLGDTIGAATPPDIDALLGVFKKEEIRRLTLHLHDTFGRAADCVARALKLGVRSFDGAAGGLGGCPYAGTKERRAPGNIDTAALVQRVQREGFETGVDREALAQAAAFAIRARDAAAKGAQS